MLFIECQEGLLGTSSILPAIAEEARAIVPAMGRLAKGAREAGATVVHLTFVPVGAGRSLNQRPPLFRGVAPAVAHWVPGDPATRPIAEIGVGPGDLVLPRHSGISPTYGTETFKVLRNMGMRTIVVAGISVNVAIPLVAAQAADEDFDVIVPTDAVAGSPAEYAAAMLKHTVAMVATLTTVDELLASLATSR